MCSKIGLEFLQRLTHCAMVMLTYNACMMHNCDVTRRLLYIIICYYMLAIVVQS